MVGRDEDVVRKFGLIYLYHLCFAPIGGGAGVANKVRDGGSKRMNISLNKNKFCTTDAS